MREVFVGRELGLGYRSISPDAQTQDKLVVEATAQQVRDAVVVFFELAVAAEQQSEALFKVHVPERPRVDHRFCMVA